jgi:hypothetical protein
MCGYRVRRVEQSYEVVTQEMLRTPEGWEFYLPETKKCWPSCLFAFPSRKECEVLRNNEMSPEILNNISNSD